MNSQAVTTTNGSRTEPQSYHPSTLRYFVDALPHISWVASSDGALRYCNQKWVEYTGLTAEMQQEGVWKRIVIPDDWAQFESWYSAVLSGQEVESPEVRFRSKDAGEQPQWFLLHMAPVNVSTPAAPVEWVGTATDISAQKHYAEDLLFSERKFSALFNSNVVGIVISGLGYDDPLLEANDVFLRLIGYTRKELERREVTWSRITSSRFQESDEEHVRYVIKHGSITPIEKEYTRKDGSSVPVLVGAARIAPESTLSINFAIDITESKALERRKDEFMGMASHELKTPLSVQKLYLHMLSKALATDGADELQALVRKISVQTDKLNTIVGDMLDVSRIDAGKIVLRKTRLNPDALVKELVEEAQLVHGKHDIRIEGSIGVPVLADRERLSQVFTNLLSNAVKYAPDVKPIIVHLGRNETHAKFCVQDFGIGIEKKDLENIFRRFFRVEGLNESTYPGMGVGLFISSDIVKRHGGRIWVDSQKGKGSSFYFEIPLAQSA